MVKIIKDIDLITEIDKYEIILVGTNINCTLGNGFQFKVRRKFPIINEMNCKTPYGNSNKLGTILPIEVGDKIFILCYITRNFQYNENKDVLDYKALEKCLKTIKKEYDSHNICSTILGTSIFEGNGDVNKVLKIFEKCNFNNITLYDYIQLSKSEENRLSYLKIKEETKDDKKEFHNRIRERKQFYAENGFFQL